MNTRLSVIMINGFQKSDDDNQWYERMFVLDNYSQIDEYYHHLGCAYTSSFEEAKRHGILPSSLRKGMCSVIIYSKKDGVWL